MDSAGKGKIQVFNCSVANGVREVPLTRDEWVDWLCDFAIPLITMIKVFD